MAMSAHEKVLKDTTCEIEALRMRGLELTEEQKALDERARAAERDLVLVDSVASSNGSLRTEIEQKLPMHLRVYSGHPDARKALMAFQRERASAAKLCAVQVGCSQREA
jgi:hypothetical protein